MAEAAVFLNSVCWAVLLLNYATGLCPAINA